MMGCAMLKVSQMVSMWMDRSRGPEDWDGERRVACVDGGWFVVSEKTLTPQSSQSLNDVAKGVAKFARRSRSQISRKLLGRARELTGPSPGTQMMMDDRIQPVVVHLGIVLSTSHNAIDSMAFI